MAFIFADYCFERDVESDFSTYPVKLTAIVGDTQAAIRRLDGRGATVLVPIALLTNIRIVQRGESPMDGAGTIEPKGIRKVAFSVCHLCGEVGGGYFIRGGGYVPHVCGQGADDGGSSVPV